MWKTELHGYNPEQFSASYITRLLKKQNSCVSRQYLSHCGYFSGGCYGVLFRKHGLAADNIIDTKLIDVNGRILDRKGMGEDLFWGIREGGGGSFGVVIAWKIKSVAVPPTVTGFIDSRRMEQNAIKPLHRWQYIAPEFPDWVYSYVALRSVNSSSQNGEIRTVLASFCLFFLGGADELVPLIQEKFPELDRISKRRLHRNELDSIYFSTSA